MKNIISTRHSKRAEFRNVRMTQCEVRSTTDGARSVKNNVSTHRLIFELQREYWTKKICDIFFVVR